MPRLAPGEDGGGERDERHGADRVGGAQLDEDAVAGGEVRDDEEAEGARQREAGGRRSGEQRVDAGQSFLVDAEALVGDADHVARLVGGAGDDDGGAGWRERGGVFEQLGEQVGDVGDGVARDGEVVAEPEVVDPREVGDFSSGGPHDVHDGDGGAPLTGLLRAREDQQALGVAAHAGGEMVELEERGEIVGFVGVAFEVVEERELAVEEALVAAREVDVEVSDAFAEQRGLLPGDGDGGLLDVAERGGELADFVVRLHGDRGEVLELLG